MDGNSSALAASPGLRQSFRPPNALPVESRSELEDDFGWNPSTPSSSDNPCEENNSVYASEVTQALGLQLDPGLSCDERDLVLKDLDRALHLRIEASSGSYFDKAFSGTDQSDLIQYLRDRIRYVLSESTDVNSRLSLGQADALAFPRLLDQTGRVGYDSGSGEGSGNGPGNGHVYLVALNIGTALWFDALAAGASSATISVGGQKIPINSSRAGIIQLGNGYSLKSEGSELHAFSPVVRISTFVHEARHSDCTGGLSNQDIGCIRSGELPGNLGCGHLHVMCPAGHPYAGVTACDDSPWGAYSIQAIFDANLEKNCTNCSLAEKIEAQAVALDAIDRVLIAKPMLSGQYGDPDMRSRGLLR